MRRILSLAALALLSGCGLHPLYSGGGSGPVAASLTQVEIAPIEGKSGWLMANALRDRLGSGGGAAYRLDVRLDDSIAGLGVRRDDSVTRERRTLRARYQLVDTSTGRTLVDAAAGSDAGIDVVQSEYATIAAENTAQERLAAIVADQVVARLALYARTGEATGPAPAPAGTEGERLFTLPGRRASDSDGAQPPPQPPQP
jgi:LPS-assembly lipoprotein